MRVVVHVGAHKTGTSLVQKYLRDKPGVTAALKIAYIGRSETNRLIEWGNRVVKDPDRLRGRLEAELGKRPAAVLISHENALGRPIVPGRAGLYPDAGTMAQALAKACAGLETYVVFYFRPIADFLESYYVQTIQQGASHTFDEWFAGLDASTISWQPTINALDEAFGADHVILGDFAEITEGQNEFLRRFMVRSGLPCPRTIKYSPVRNASISARGLQIALEINQHLQTKEERRATRKFLQEHFSNQREERATPMPEEVRRSLEDRTADEYARLSARAATALASPPATSPEPPPLSRLATSRIALASKPLLMRNAASRRLVRRLLHMD